MLMILITSKTTKITSNDDDDEYLGFCFTSVCVRVDYYAVQTDFY